MDSRDDGSGATRNEAIGFSRRQVLGTGLAGLALLMGRGVWAAERRPGGARGVPISRADRLVVPDDHVAEVLYGWGDATGVAGPDGRALPIDGPLDARRQALVSGTGHDGIELFTLPTRDGTRPDPDRLLLAVNHEFAELDELLADPARASEPDAVALTLAAHGVSIVELRRRRGIWTIVRPSPLARRITGATPMRLAGPVAGTPQVVTEADPTGREVIGTLANCAVGQTPWGTLLSCEENIDDYFLATAPTPSQARFDLRAEDIYPLHAAEPRFDAARHPNEWHRFGWVVEIDPYDPKSTPIKRTALGRFKHEGATVVRDGDGRVAVVMGDDQAFEHLYKFVCADRLDPANPAAARDMLDRGTLYVARFDADGRGAWLPLVFDAAGPLGPARGFTSQADVLVRAREAATALGATPLDRPEWVAAHPTTRECFVSLTNNRARGAPDKPGADAANPRATNHFGQILSWREDGDSVAATTFRWDVFMLAGDPAAPDPTYHGTVRGDGFACPDALRFDAQGRLWIGTDAPTSGTSPVAALGNNQLLLADTATGQVRRFMVAPVGAEVTGIALTPDARTLFVSIQHPSGAWPEPGKPARSAVVAIRKRDGGVVGA